MGARRTHMTEPTWTFRYGCRGEALGQQKGPYYVHSTRIAPGVAVFWPGLYSTCFVDCGHYSLCGLAHRSGHRARRERREKSLLSLVDRERSPGRHNPQAGIVVPPIRSRRSRPQGFGPTRGSHRGSTAAGSVLALRPPHFGAHSVLQLAGGLYYPNPLPRRKRSTDCDLLRREPGGPSPFCRIPHPQRMLISKIEESRHLSSGLPMPNSKNQVLQNYFNSICWG
jgi:hypothetical protein